MRVVFTTGLPSGALIVGETEFKVCAVPTEIVA
jgi:hypothetical protein